MDGWYESDHKGNLMIEFIISFLQISFPWVIFLLMILSLAAQIIPIYPGGVIVWILALLFGFVNPAGFENGGALFFALISILMLGSIVSDNIIMGKKAREAGASWFNLMLTLIAAIVGTILTTPIGGLVICAGVLFLLEYLRSKDAKLAWKITTSLLIGFGWSSVIRILIVIIQILIWSIWAFRVY